MERFLRNTIRHTCEEPTCGKPLGRSNRLEKRFCSGACKTKYKNRALVRAQRVYTALLVWGDRRKANEPERGRALCYLQNSVREWRAEDNAMRWLRTQQPDRSMDDGRRDG